MGCATSRRSKYSLSSSSPLRSSKAKTPMNPGCFPTGDPLVWPDRQVVGCLPVAMQVLQAVWIEICHDVFLRWCWFVAAEQERSLSMRSADADH